MIPSSHRPRGGAADRDLYVDYVQIGDETAHAESRAVSYDKGAIDGREVYASDGNMFWNGALRLTQQYRYNSIGNLTHKEGATFGYGTQASSCAAGALNKPHALVNGLGTSNCYDAAGNMVSGGGRTISWNQEQMPLSVTAGGVTESYSYNGDSQRVTITRSGVTTIFVEGLYEEESTGKVRTYYTLNGHTVAVRETEGSTVTIRSLHSDHLGSISASTKRDASNNPAWASLQQFDPWGKVRLTAVQSPPYGTGEAPINQTARGFTGQRLDETGLMHYNARLYDPALGRFVSADSIVPGRASASGGSAATLGHDKNAALQALTVAFHELTFTEELNRENRISSQQGFWFQLNDDAQQKYGIPWGPSNPQALNRYAYVLNNPLRYVDPTGHAPGEKSILGYSYSYVRGEQGKEYTYGDLTYQVDSKGRLYRDTPNGRYYLMKTCVRGYGCKNVDSAESNFTQFKGAVDGMWVALMTAIAVGVTVAVVTCVLLGAGGCVAGIAASAVTVIVTAAIAIAYYSGEASSAYDDIYSLKLRGVKQKRKT